MSQQKRIPKKMRRMIRRTVAAAAKVAVKLATGKNFSINPAFIRVDHTSGSCYGFAFGDFNNSHGTCGSGQVFIRGHFEGAAVDFNSWFLLKGQEFFKGNRWFNLHRARSFRFSVGTNGRPFYDPPQEPIIYDRKGRPLDFALPVLAQEPTRSTHVARSSQ